MEGVEEYHQPVPAGVLQPAEPAAPEQGTPPTPSQTPQTPEGAGSGGQQGTAEAQQGVPAAAEGAAVVQNPPHPEEPPAKKTVGHKKEEEAARQAAPGGAEAAAAPSTQGAIVVWQSAEAGSKLAAMTDRGPTPPRVKRGVQLGGTEQRLVRRLPAAAVRGGWQDDTWHPADPDVRMEDPEERREPKGKGKGGKGTSGAGSGGNGKGGKGSGSSNSGVKQSQPPPGASGAPRAAGGDQESQNGSGTTGSGKRKGKKGKKGKGGQAGAGQQGEGGENPLAGLALPKCVLRMILQTAVEVRLLTGAVERAFLLPVAHSLVTPLALAKTAYSESLPPLDPETRRRGPHPWGPERLVLIAQLTEWVFQQLCWAREEVQQEYEDLTDTLEEQDAIVDRLSHTPRQSARVARYMTFKEVSDDRWLLRITPGQGKVLWNGKLVEGRRVVLAAADLMVEEEVLDGAPPGPLERELRRLVGH